MTSVTDTEVDKSAKQTFAPALLQTRIRWLLDAVSNEFGGGDQTLVLGRKVTAPNRMPKQ